jgi:hypothetical protein
VTTVRIPESDHEASVWTIRSTTSSRIGCSGSIVLKRRMGDSRECRTYDEGTCPQPDIRLRTRAFDRAAAVLRLR